MTSLFDLSDDKPDNWDPEISERSYFRDATGNLGWLVRRDGADHMKLDRAGVDQTRPYRPAEWKEEFRPYPMTEAQIGMVCFAADKEMRRFLGLVNKHPNDWAALSESQRSDWIHTGPETPTHRAILWQAIQNAMKGMKV